MRKACMAGISVLIGISMLAGCGKSLDADTDKTEPCFRWMLKR